LPVCNAAMGERPMERPAVKNRPFMRRGPDSRKAT
jgi:hypothetical protein